MTLHIFVAHEPESIALLTQHLDAAAYPESPAYRRHLTFRQLNSLMAPRIGSLVAIRVWIEGAGVSWNDVKHNLAQDILTVELRVGEAEVLLQAEYYNLAANTGVRDKRRLSIVRAARYSLPDSIKRFVDVVGPTSRLPAMPPLATAESGGALGTTTDATCVKPAWLRSRYGTSKYTLAEPSTNSSLAITGSLATSTSIRMMSPTSLARTTGRR